MDEHEFGQIQCDDPLAGGVEDSLREWSLGIISNMATARDCIRNYVLDIERWLESGNFDLDGIVYIVFRLDWIVSILLRYSNTEGLNVRVINVLRKARDMLM